MFREKKNWLARPSSCRAHVMGRACGPVDRGLVKAQNGGFLLTRGGHPGMGVEKGSSLASLLLQGLISG